MLFTQKQRLPMQNTNNKITNFLFNFLKLSNISSLQNRYIPALTLVALFSTLAYINVTKIMSSIHNDGKLINTSGRQRMLSQKLIVDASNVLSQNDSNSKEILRETIATMKESHLYLLNNIESNYIKDIYKKEDIDKELTLYLEQFTFFINHSNQKLFRKLTNQSKNILIKLDKIVIAHEYQNKIKMEQLKKREKYLYLLTILTLIFESIFIFYPAGRQIKKNQKQLQQEIDFKTKELQNSINIINKNVIYSRTDLKGKIVYASEAFSTISGYSQLELLGKSHNIVRHPDMDQTAFKQMWETIESGKEWVGEVKNLKKNGDFYWVNAFIAPEYDTNGSLIGYAAVRHNITDKKYIQELNKSLSIKINQEVEKNRQKDQLLFEQDKRMQLTELMGNIAHQWRQPLSIISSCASGLELLKEFDTLSDESFYKGIQNIVNHTQDLSSTIETFTRFVNSEYKVEKFALSELLDEIKNIINQNLTDNNIVFTMVLEDELIELTTIKNDLITVFLHILNNARDILMQRKIKNPSIKIFAKQIKDEIIISIEDNGGGVSNDIIRKIFNPYFTTKHPSMGTGMGLYLSYLIITKNLNGVIFVDNTKDGAEFILKLRDIS